MDKAKSIFQSPYEPYAGENAEMLFHSYVNMTILFPLRVLQ